MMGEIGAVDGTSATPEVQLTLECSALSGLLTSTSSALPTFAVQ